METIVAIAPPESALVSNLRLAGWRVRHLAPDSELSDWVVLNPDVLVFDLSVDALSQALEDLKGLEALSELPTLALLDLASLRQLPKLGTLSDFVLPQSPREEWSARVRRLLKPSSQVTQNEGPVLSCGGLLIDSRTFSVQADGQSLELTYQEFLLLRYLVGHPEQAHTREQLLAKVWGWDYYGGARTVDIHVRRVRAKIGAYATWLQTVRHVGYRWNPNADASTHDEDAPRETP